MRVLTEPCLKEAVEAIGAEFTPFTEYFVRTNRQEEIFFDWQATSPPAALSRTLENVIFGPARQTAAAVSRALDEAPADAIVVDWLLPAAAAVGEARGLPTAVLIHCINMLPAPGRPTGPFPPARGPLGQLRDRFMRFMFRRLVGRHAAALAFAPGAPPPPLPRPFAGFLPSPPSAPPPSASPPSSATKLPWTTSASPSRIWCPSPPARAA